MAGYTDRSQQAADPASAVRRCHEEDAGGLRAGLESGDARRAAGGRAERAARADRRRRVRQPEHVRWCDPDAELHAARGERAALQPLSRHGALLADQGGAADGAQSPPGRLRHGRRVLRPLPGLQRDRPARLRAVSAHPAGERLSDRGVREIGILTPVQPAGLLGAVRPLAEPARVRLLLGLPRRRGRTVRPPDRREPEDRRRAGGQGRRAVLLPGRPRRQDDRLASRGPLREAGHAVVRLRRNGVQPRAAPRAA